MGLFGFGAKPTSENILILHAEGGSVAGAYVTIKNGTATIWSNTRVLADRRQGEDGAAAFERALTSLCAILIRDGVPALMRGTGSARVSRTVAYIGAPWAETRMRTESVDLGREFTVSHATYARALAHETARDPNRRHTEDTVIATLLNGYETHQPLGKRVRRADFIIRSSSIQELAAKTVERVLRSSLQERHPQLAASAPGMYHAIRALYPLEEDYFILEADNDTTTAASVESHVLANVQSSDHGLRELKEAAKQAGVHASAVALVNNSFNQQFAMQVESARSVWKQGVTTLLKMVAESRTPPRTLFLIADEGRDFVKNSFNDQSFKDLWLSGEPPRIIPVTPQSVLGVQSRGTEPADLQLMLLARAESVPR